MAVYVERYEDPVIKEMEDRDEALAAAAVAATDEILAAFREAAGLAMLALLRKAGTYAALGSGMIGGYEHNQIDRSDTKWPSTKASMEAIERRVRAIRDLSRFELELPARG